MQDRQSELDEFKRLNLSVIAASCGYEIDKRRTTRSTVMMSSGSDKIAISKKGSHYVYWSVHDDQSKGTVIDFVQRVVEPGCTMGRVRQILRPYLGTGYMTSLKHENRGRFVSKIGESKLDLAAVANRYEKFVPIVTPHEYLCNTRGIPFELLQSPRLQGRVLNDPKWGSAIFPHWGCPGRAGSDQRELVGYEIKGKMSLFSKGGTKGLWTSAGMKGDRVLAIGESGLDALSYMAVRGEEGLRVGSIAGRLNPSQPTLLKSAIERMQEDSTIVAAFDNDLAGDELVQQLSDLVQKVGRSDLAFMDDRPAARGTDWNQVLMDRQRVRGLLQVQPWEYGR